MTDDVSHDADRPEPADVAAHWQRVWAAKVGGRDMSWYQDEPQPCLDLVISYSSPGDRVVTVGAGTSSLAARLVGLGRGVTVVDIDAAPLGRLRAELPSGCSVDAIQADVRDLVLPAPVQVWHDRATFHFLTERADRRRYAGRAAEAVVGGGAMVIATFASDGPTQCSGIDVARYDATSLAAEFAPEFVLVEARRVVHSTPWGASQPFTYLVLRRGRAEQGGGRHLPEG